MNATILEALAASPAVRQTLRDSVDRFGTDRGLAVFVALMTEAITEIRAGA